ncbi:MAG: hypothetical protein RIQ47_368 [Bacteroidota bacterium]|jgi:hypothetical protein
MKHTLLFSLILAALLSGFAANAQSPSLRGIYVNDFDVIFPSTQKQDSLLQYAKDSSFNYLALYDLHTLNFGSSTTVSALASFIRKARDQYGIQYIGAVGESYSFFSNRIFPYNNGRTNATEKFNVFNVEFEFWIQASVTTGGYYCTQYLQAANCGCDTAGAFRYYADMLRKVDSLANLQSCMSETYVGWFNQGQGQQIAANVDRVLLHAYRIDPTSVFGYSKIRLGYLGSTTRVVKVAPIFSSEPVFMGPWLQSNPQIAAWNKYLADFTADNSTWKSKINLEGFQWFNYGLMPKPSAPISGGSVSAPTISANGSTSFCAGGSVTLTASSGSSYLWSNGAATQSITVSTSGNFTCNVTSNGSTQTTNAISVTVNNLPSASINVGSATVNGVPLTANTAAGSGVISSIQWFRNGITITGATGTTLMATSDGSYTVRVQNSNGCSLTSNAASVIVPAVPAACTLTTPSGLFTSSITSSSAVLSWNSLPACDSLLFRIRVEGSNTYIYISIAYNGQNSFSLNNLLSSKRYSWRMRTKCGTNTSGYSERIYFTTTAAGSTSRMEEPVIEVRTLVEGIIAYPNPANDQLSLRTIADEVSEAMIQITDLSGRILKQENVMLLEGENLHRFELIDLSTGLYLVSVIYPDEILTTRVNVIH